MPKLLRNLRLGLKAIRLNSSGHSEPALNASLLPILKKNPASGNVDKEEFSGLSEEYLMHIIKQVKAEGFYVERLNIFRYGNLKPGEAIYAIERWAAEVGLKVNFNHEHELCFFEQL